MVLTDVDIINGIFGLIVVVIDILIGIKIISKYFKYKDKMLILVGATWIIMSELYWPVVMSVLLSIINGGDGLYQDPEIYFFYWHHIFASWNGIVANCNGKIFMEKLSKNRINNNY